MRVVSLESPWKGHQPLYVFNFNFWSWIFYKSSKFWAAPCKNESNLLQWRRWCQGWLEGERKEILKLQVFYLNPDGHSFSIHQTCSLNYNPLYSKKNLKMFLPKLLMMFGLLWYNNERKKEKWIQPPACSVHGLHRILSSYWLVHCYLMKKSTKVQLFFGLDSGMM